MSCRSTRTSAMGLLVAALLCSALLTPRLPTACARHVAVLKAKHGLDVVGEVDAGKAGGGSRPIRTAEMRPAARKHAWDEMHDMLRRDYVNHPRGNKPVHNAEPLRQDEP